jgi:hypothetical protein
MKEEPGLGAVDLTQTWLQESAFPTSLSLFEVVAKFWTELKKLLPAKELHVIDPYLLDAGGSDAAVYAGNVVSLLKPAFNVVGRLVIVHGKPREGIRELLTEDISRVSPDI